MRIARKASLLALSAAALSGCSTINMRSADFLKAPEFQDDVASMEQGFMAGSDIPAAPREMRSAAQWDQAARELEALGASLEVPEVDAPLSPQDFASEYQQLQDYAVEYREDDPQ